MQSRNLSVTVVAVIALALVPIPSFAAAAGPARSTNAVSAEVVDASGLSLVGPDAIQFRPENEAQAVAFDAALNVALANRDDMGYPWIDLDTKTLELSASDALGRKAARLAETTLSTHGLTTRITTALASIAKLDEIADDVTR